MNWTEASGNIALHFRGFEPVGNPDYLHFLQATVEA